MTFDYNCWRMILNEYFRQLDLAIVNDEDISRDIVLHSIAGMFGKDGPQRTTIQRWVNAFENHGDIGPRRERTKKFWTRIVPVHLDLARVLEYCSSNIRQRIIMRYASEYSLFTAYCIVENNFAKL